MSGLEYAFWGIFFLLIFAYAGYPLVAFLLSMAGRKHNTTEPHEWPALTMIISAYNEAEVIAEKLDNTLQLDYPPDKFNVVVISDASDDETDAIVQNHPDERVRLIRIEGRRGKTHGISQVAPTLDSEIIVFSDANAMYRPDALRRLVRHFSRDNVGYVVGNAQYYQENQSHAGEHESTYWDMEVRLKEWESRIGSVVGGDGAIYAIRRHLFQKLEDDDINDFVNPLHIILQGYRGVFEPTAICYEHTADSYEKEIGRKRRIVNRSWRGLMKNKAVLNPFRTGIHAFQVASHKLLRWLGGVMLLLLLVLNAFLWPVHDVYKVIMGLQVLFYLLAALGGLLIKKNGRAPFLFSTPYFFVAVNLASILGIADNYMGRKYTTWQTVREV
ncbi:MAG: glycosyltransferase family 2 protein [Calditrichaeota bacterium]|nr:MAG: glycosyltransferase family 2 protein [Calditrichota bacterium]